MEIMEADAWLSSGLLTETSGWLRYKMVFCSTVLFVGGFSCSDQNLMTSTQAIWYMHLVSYAFSFVLWAIFTSTQDIYSMHLVSYAFSFVLSAIFIWFVWCSSNKRMKTRSGDIFVLCVCVESRGCHLSLPLLFFILVPLLLLLIRSCPFHANGPFRSTFFFPRKSSCIFCWRFCCCIMYSSGWAAMRW